jgi:hypothetical protein
MIIIIKKKNYFESIKLPLDASIEIFAFKRFFYCAFEMRRNIITVDKFEND